VKRSVLTIAVAGVVVAVLDQASKSLVRSNLRIGEAHDLGPLLTIVHVRNSGIAFGLLSGLGMWVVLGSILVAIVLLMSLAAMPPPSKLASIGMGLVLGGAMGNLADRVRIGHVTDFIKVPHWPAFNVADSGIVVGVSLIALASLRAPSPSAEEADAA
jgi:signal peptidase II